jgi:predicted solute-binding protein
VLLFRNGQFSDLEKIWLDPSSRTSNLLVRILRERASENGCEFIMPDADEAPDVENLPEGIGRLIIGDRALRYSSDSEKDLHFIDLGELWREKTNHPFTFARWIARNGDVAGELRDLVREVRDWSMLHLHELIEPLAEEYEFDAQVVDRYLRFNITYMHGPREQAGEREFLTEARKLLSRGAAQ